MAFYDRELKMDEELIRIVRMFPFALLPRLGRALIILLLPFFLIIPLFKLETLGFFNFTILTALGLVLVVRVIVIAYFNCFLITNQRVIDWDQRGLFDRVVSEAEYGSIQDVAYRVKGIFGTMLDYGSLQIQTAGGSVTLELPFTRHPRQIQSLIRDIKMNMITSDKDTQG